jgi:PadR family transcriptional regulator PadR
VGKYLLGEFEHLVLLSVLKLDDDAYGVSITNDLEDSTGKPVAQAATYLTLRRLEEKGWISGIEGEATAKRGGRVKRYYTLTTEGLLRLKTSRDILMSMWAEVGKALS